MKYLIEKSKHMPAYLQLYTLVRDDIVGGIYPFGSKLPSKRSVADDSCVSTVTVEHAYALLCDEGYIEPRERSGYFVIFHTEDGFAPAPAGELAKAPDVHLRGDPSDEFPFSILAKTMRRVMSDYGEDILDRSPNEGCVKLREEIRDYLARSRGIIAHTEQIIIGSGSEYLYNLIVGTLGRGRIYAIESPSYNKIEKVYRASDVKYEMLRLGADGIESSELRRSGAEILHITPYRSYPSGVTATASKRHEYLRWAAAGDRYIVEDDFESEFSVSHKPEETLFSLSDRDNIIYVNTFSKTVSTSFRVGYMILPEHLVPVFHKNVGFYSCTVPTFMQFVLAELLSNGDFARHINRIRRKKRNELKNG